MLSQDTTSFIENWTAKVKNIKGDDLNAVYQRFGDLYIIYSRLCNDASSILVVDGIISSIGGDQKAATENVIRYLGADNIMNAFIANNNINDIEAIVNVIPHFNIKFDRNGVYQPQTDQDLLNNLQSSNNTVKVLAVLQTIYYVRCNFFHSRKDYQEYQRLLVEPLINILQTLNTMLITELSK
jgi:hypothetical protein